MNSKKKKLVINNPLPAGVTKDMTAHKGFKTKKDFWARVQGEYQHFYNYLMDNSD